MALPDYQILVRDGHAQFDWVCLRSSHFETYYEWDPQIVKSLNSHMSNDCQEEDILLEPTWKQFIEGLASGRMERGIACTGSFLSGS